MIIVDTTVLAYAVGEEHPLREPCRRLLAAHASGTIEATTTVEVLQEFAHVRARRRTREDAVNLTRLYLVALNPIVQRQKSAARSEAVPRSTICSISRSPPKRLTARIVAPCIANSSVAP